MKAIDLLARPPLTDMSAHLKLLADALPEGTLEVAVVCRNEAGETTAFGYGEVQNNRIALAGLLFAAAVDVVK